MRAFAGRVGEVAGLVALSTPLFTFEAFACSTCIGWGKDGQVWSGGFIWSTLFLLVLPFVLAGVAAGWVYHLHRRAARLRHGTATASRLILTQKESGE